MDDSERWSLALLEALTPPLLQRAKLRAQRIAAAREAEAEAEAERGRRGRRGHILGDGSTAATAATTETSRDTTCDDEDSGSSSGDDGEGGSSDDDENDGVEEREGPDAGNRRRRRRRRRRRLWDLGRLREVFSRAVTHAARAVDDATLAAFAPSADPDVPEPTDPTHGFFPRLHLAAFYLWVSEL